MSVDCRCSHWWIGPTQPEARRKRKDSLGLLPVACYDFEATVMSSLVEGFEGFVEFEVSSRFDYSADVVDFWYAPQFPLPSLVVEGLRYWVGSCPLARATSRQLHFLSRCLADCTLQVRDPEERLPRSCTEIGHGAKISVHHHLVACKGCTAPERDVLVECLE